MFAQFSLITLILAIVMLPRVLAIHYSTRSEEQSEEAGFDYR